MIEIGDRVVFLAKARGVSERCRVFVVAGWKKVPGHYRVVLELEAGGEPIIARVQDIRELEPGDRAWLYHDQLCAQERQGEKMLAGIFVRGRKPVEKKYHRPLLSDQPGPFVK